MVEEKLSALFLLIREWKENSSQGGRKNFSFSFFFFKLSSYLIFPLKFFEDVKKEEKEFSDVE